MKLSYITCNFPYSYQSNIFAISIRNDIVVVEERTRGQASSKLWFAERQWRMTASRFGEIFKATHRRIKGKLCQSLVATQRFNNKACDRKSFRRRPVEKFENLMHIKVKPCWLFVCDNRSYLGVSPDGLIGRQLNWREVPVQWKKWNKNVAGKCFNFLTFDGENKVVLRQNSDYYLNFHIQGQLYISQIHNCYLVVFKFKPQFKFKCAEDRVWPKILWGILVAKIGSLLHKSLQTLFILYTLTCRLVHLCMIYDLTDHCSLSSPFTWMLHVC